MASVFKREKQCKHWHCSFKAATGKRVEECTKQATKRAAQAYAADRERAEEQQRESPGESRPEPEKTTAEAMTVYLAHWGVREESTEESRKGLKKHLLLVLKECRFLTLGDLSGRTLGNWLVAQRQKGLAPGTTNRYRDVAVRFGKFCVEQGWLRTNPLALTKRLKNAGKKLRRALTPDELARLLKVTIGKRRHRVYQVAALSGLRGAELRALQRCDFELGDRPLWRLRAAITKSKRADVVPMLPECATMLGRFWDFPEDRRVFAGAVPSHKTFNEDLVAAGIDKVNAAGKELNFHCLRYTFCTLLGRSHMPIQHVKKLMRHRNIKETCDLYLDLGLEDTEDEVSKLPRFDINLTSKEEE